MSLFTTDDTDEHIERELDTLLQREGEQLSIPVQEIPDGDENNTRHVTDLNIVLSLRIKFQQEIVQKLISEDGLLILGKGLGLDSIVANLLHVLSLSTIRDKKSLILLINAQDFENFKINEELMELEWLDSNNNIKFNVIGGSNANTVDKRKIIYESGGIVSLSNRVLVTDLLSEIIDPNLVTGMIVMHAEKIREYSNDRFVINLYRSKNKWGFIKAVSEDAEACLRGSIQPLLMKLKYLKLESSFLWPRFHVDVIQSFKKKNTVTEIKIQLTDYMKKIQTAIMACIEALIGEIKRNNTELATDYWSIDNALDDHFVQTIRLTLDPVWHRLSFTTKQILGELTLLKDLLRHLFTIDSVRFFEEVNALVEAGKPSISNFNKPSAAWLMVDESMAIITCAKSRVFDKLKDKEISSKDVTDDYTYYLEELPKWEHLSATLEEINQDKMTKDSTEDGPILIMCKSWGTCNQLSRYLTTQREIAQVGNRKVFSGRKLMVRSLKEHLAWKSKVGKSSSKIQKTLRQLQQQRPKEKAGEEQLSTSRTFVRGRGPPTKRRRARGGAVIAAHGRMLNKEDKNSSIGDVDENMVKLVEDQLKENGDDDDGEEYQNEKNNEQEENEDDFDMFLEQFEDRTTRSANEGLIYELLDRTDQIIIERLDTKANELLLNEVMPSHIIIYEPDLTFVRQIEVYQAHRSKNPAKCYFMIYDNSIEEEIYLNSVKKEKDAFTRLIREKANLPKIFTTDEDEQTKFLHDLPGFSTVSTRIAGGSGDSVVEKTKVIVDSREFRSQLPFLCYLSGLEVIPCMITVGDYILSPKICIERKSIPDLIGSLQKGRLYQQCEQMFKFYEIPVLLIEFEEGKSFSLEPFTTGFRDGIPNVILNQPTSSANGQLANLQLKLMVLITSFPTLKIIWSSSPFETAKVFKELKKNQDEPSIEESINFGLNPLFNKDTKFNDYAIELLRNIPGVTDVNYVLLVQKVQSIKTLSQMKVEQLTPIVGAESANKIVKFFNRRV